MGGREVSRPYRVFHRETASGFYPFGIAKRLFFMFFVSVAPVFIHRAQILAYIKKKPERREYLFGSGIYKK